MNHSASTQELTLGGLLTGLMHNVQTLLRPEVALATREVHSRGPEAHPRRHGAGLGLGIAAMGGWRLIMMLVHLFHALTALPPRARESYSWLGTQKLGRMHLVLQATLGTLKETV